MQKLANARRLIDCSQLDSNALYGVDALIEIVEALIGDKATREQGENGFTPGRWERDRYCITNENGRIVAVSGDTPENWGADARLICAAKPMLEALESIVEYWSVRPTSPEFSDKLIKAMGAINLATKPN